MQASVLQLKETIWIETRALQLKTLRMLVLFDVFLHYARLIADLKFFLC